jgi:hypothetical protein
VATSDGDACIADALEVNGAVDIAGASTLTGAVTASSTLAVTSAITATGGVSLGGEIDANGNVIDEFLRTVVTKTDDYTITTADCGTVLIMSTDTKTFTMPAVAAGNLGCEITFINNAADGGAIINISPNASDWIAGQCSAVIFAATDDKDMQNTKATHDIGDTVTIISNGSTGWNIVACNGVWAQE